MKTVPLLLGFIAMALGILGIAAISKAVVTLGMYFALLAGTVAILYR